MWCRYQIRRLLTTSAFVGFGTHHWLVPHMSPTQSLGYFEIFLGIFLRTFLKIFFRMFWINHWLVTHMSPTQSLGYFGIFSSMFCKYWQYLDLTIYLSHTCHHLNIWNIFENISLIFIQTLTQVYRVWDAENPAKVKLKIYVACTTIARNFITPDICIFCKRDICIFLHQVFAYFVQHATGIWQLLRWKSDSTM